MIFRAPEASQFRVGAMSVDSPTSFGSPRLTAIAVLLRSPGNGSTYFVDLTGQANNLPFGGLEQTISTTAGDVYVLSFALGSATTWNLGNLAGSALTASATGTSLLASQLFTASTPTTVNDWQTETLSFTADSASTTIRVSRQLHQRQFQIHRPRRREREPCERRGPRGLDLGIDGSGLRQP